MKNVSHAFFFLFLCTLSCSPLSKHAKKQTGSGIAAVSVDNFLNSIGVCSSIASRGETLEGTIKVIRYTGIRWIRSGLEDRVTATDMIRLHNETGVKFAYGLLSGGNNISAVIDTCKQLADAGALLAIEGNNEPNNWGIIHHGETGGRDKSWLPVAKLQRDLYQAVKTNATLKGYPVWSISESGAQTDNAGLQFLMIPENASTLMPARTRYADYANCHNYITHPAWPGLHNNQTWLSASPGSDCPVDGLYKNYGSTWRNHFAGYSESELPGLPRVTTETGYPVGGVVTEEIQARLFLNLYLSQFKRGWSHTAIYLLRTRANEKAHESYAFYKLDYSPKQAAHYLHYFIAILNDTSSGQFPGMLDYSIVNQSANVHDLLLQKRNGKFYLVIWAEKFTGGAEEVKVNLGRAYPLVNIYDPTVGTSSVKTLTKVRKVKLTMTDHPLILEIF